MKHQSPVRCKASIRIYSDDLIPEEITPLLRTEPTLACRKGDANIGKRTGKNYPRHTGAWILKSKLDPYVPLHEKIDALIAQLPGEVTIWDTLAARYNLDIFCGIFLNDSCNQIFQLPTSTLTQIAAKHLIVTFDCYGPRARDSDEQHEK